MKRLIKILILVVVVMGNLSVAAACPPGRGSVHAIPAEMRTTMIGCSWKPECPVALDDLRYLTIPYYGYDGKNHEGVLIVHAVIADETLDIFAELFQARFPIERMTPIDDYAADDEQSMSANNTSAFCFRANTSNPLLVSNHGYGLAIDINPLVNPYYRRDHDAAGKLTKTVIAPAGGAAFLDRSLIYKGAITDAPDNACYQAFAKRGYQWGGQFKDYDAKPRFDWQHFEKSPEQVGIVIARAGS
jgi:hypothetical protein